MNSAIVGLISLHSFDTVNPAYSRLIADLNAENCSDLVLLASVGIEKLSLESRFESSGNRALNVVIILTKSVLRLGLNSSKSIGLRSVTVNL
jgi:hypothetical protein